VTAFIKSFSRACLVVSTLSVLVMPASGAPADQVSQTAYEYFDAGRYKDAYPLFLRMVNRDSSDLRAKYYLAVVCQRTGQIHNAIQMYVQIVALAPQSNEARYSKAALNILAHRKKIPPNIPASASVPPLGSTGSAGGSGGIGSNSGAGSVNGGGGNGASPSVNTLPVGMVPDRDMLAAQTQAAELLSSAKRQADALDAKADAIEKDMASVLKPKGNGPAYTKADIDAETADMRKQSVEIRARGLRESDDVLKRAKLRQEATSHH
jgi:tetratricopeptide (TPR) repeat protein